MDSPSELPGGTNSANRFISDSYGLENGEGIHFYVLSPWLVAIFYSSCRKLTQQGMAYHFPDPKSGITSLVCLIHASLLNPRHIIKMHLIGTWMGRAA